MDDSFFTLDNFPTTYLLSTSIQMFYHLKNIIGNGVQQNFDINITDTGGIDSKGNSTAIQRIRK